MKKKKEIIGNKISYINSQMRIINNLTDTIYESLMDEDTESLNAAIDSLIPILRDCKEK